MTPVCYQRFLPEIFYRFRTKLSHTYLNTCVSFPEQQIVNKPVLCLKDRMEFYYLHYGSAATKEAA